MLKGTVTDGQSFAQFIHHAGQFEQPFTWSIEAGVKEGRRAAQNRLSHRWYADVARCLEGHEVSDVRAISKLHHGVPLMRELHDDFREKWDRLVKDRFTYTEKLEMMLDPVDFPVTRLMTVGEMTEYMNRIDRYWTQAGASLTLPDEAKGLQR